MFAKTRVLAASSALEGGASRVKCPHYSREIGAPDYLVLTGDAMGCRFRTVTQILENLLADDLHRDIKTSVTLRLSLEPRRYVQADKHPAKPS